jgi:DnaK suppressor protein
VVAGVCPFPPEVLAELSARLDESRRALLAEYEGDVEREREAPLDQVGDVVDRAEIALEREAMFASGESEREALLQIEDALARMWEGTYGLCQEGGEPIPLERLRAVPWARCCAAHQEDLDRRQGRLPAPGW